MKNLDIEAGGDSVHGLFAVIQEWVEVAKMEEVLSKAERDTANAAMARARAGTLRNCARELSEYITANASDHRHSLENGHE